MKMTITTIIALAISSFAFAEGTTAPATAAPTAAEATAATTEMKKMTRKEAKAACKAEGKKGKELKACMKSKHM